MRAEIFGSGSGDRGDIDEASVTGAYTRPGTGLPMCLISGEHAAEALIADC